MSIGLAAMVGCGDDDGGGSDDPDAAPDEADATPDDPDAAPDEVTVFGPEGGEFRLEYIVIDDGTIITRVTAFGMKDAGSGETPDRFPLPPIPGCWDLTDDSIWPVAQSSDADYIDFGTVVVTGDFSGVDEIVIPKVDQSGGDVADGVGRTHEEYNFRLDFDNADTVFQGDSTYSVLLGGSDEWPAQAYDMKVYMPPAFDLIDPALGEVVMIEEDTPLTLTWEATEVDDHEVISAVAFATPADGPTIVCAEIGNDGEIVIPAEEINKVVALVGEGNQATIARQTAVHEIAELTNGDDVSGRRIDLLSIWCYATTFEVAVP